MTTELVDELLAAGATWADGTVDKFQGQEAPTVIYSMATSRPEAAPRGMEFLYAADRRGARPDGAGVFDVAADGTGEWVLSGGAIHYRKRSVLMSKSIDDVPFQPCEALPIAFQVIDQIGEESSAPQLERYLVRDLTHYVHISGHDLPDVVTSMGVNLGFVCDGVYPQEELDQNPVTLQLDADGDGKFSLIVYLTDDGCPSIDYRKKIVEAGGLQRLKPHRGTEHFTTSANCSRLETGWCDEDVFSEAVAEAVCLFVLREVG